VEQLDSPQVDKHNRRGTKGGKVAREGSTALIGVVCNGLGAAQATRKEDMDDKNILAFYSFF
jgi:hypothetical protein